MILFRNKYRIESARLPNWDYSSAGFYFIIICTRNRIQYFGKIVDGKMVLSKTGVIADRFWREIPNHFTNVRLDEYVIMPNHIHGIIEIVYGITEHPAATAVPAAITVETPKLGVSTEFADNTETGTVNTETKTNGCVNGDKGTGKSDASMKKPTLGIIINQFKRICTITTHKKDIPFAWQPRFYDHIIRDDVSLNKIREYIKNNPINWDTDEENQTHKPPRYVAMPNPQRP